MKTAPTEPDLTFHWPVEKGFPYVLFACVAGSLFAHVATFFLFQVVYPQRVTIPQSAPHVSLLTPDSRENIALLRWVEAEDPALIAGNNSVTPTNLAEVRYVPSFAAPRTAPLGAPEEKPHEVSFPPAIDRLTATVAAPHPPISAPRQSQTTIQFSGALASRALGQNPPLDITLRSTAPIRPTVVLIGVSADGEVIYEFLQESSGDPAFDELAIAHLLRIHFAFSDSVIAWSRVTFAWGTDAYAEQEDPKSSNSNTR